MAKLLEPFAGDRSEHVAQKLIGHFGSLARAMAAEPIELAAVLPEDDDALQQICAARRLVETASREHIIRGPVSARDLAFRRYLNIKLAGLSTEVLHATFVDARHGYIADEQVAEGSCAHIDVHVRRLLGRALALGARGLILAHNHPSGSPEPSPADCEGTKAIAALGRALEIELLDHLIIAGPRVFSFRERGLLV